MILPLQDLVRRQREISLERIVTRNSATTITRVVKLLDKRNAENERVTTLEDQLQFLISAASLL